MQSGAGPPVSTVPHPKLWRRLEERMPDNSFDNKIRRLNVRRTSSLFQQMAHSEARNGQHA